MTQLVTNVRVAKRANRYGEWVVRAWDEQGNRMPEADYFASDEQDAYSTALAMLGTEERLDGCSIL
jgi:hypothetical protein